MSEPAQAPLPPSIPKHIPPPPLVVFAGWLIPGAGYWLIGQRARGLVIGITIIILFMGGVLLGGVRALQVPGYGENGGKLYVVEKKHQLDDGRYRMTREIVEHVPREGSLPPDGHWVATDFRTLLADVGNKPWSICQIMAGPLTLGNAAWSVSASRPVLRDDGTTGPSGELSHSRINEIAVLYMAVAGMLNLLAMIDAAGRADDLLAATSGRRSRGLHLVVGSLLNASDKK